MTANEKINQTGALFSGNRRWFLKTASSLPLALASTALLSGCGRDGDQSAPNAAKADIRKSDDEEDESRPVIRQPEALAADIVIVGGGGAGLACAARAAELGASVIVLEKMPALGGNTIIASGYYAAVDPARQAPAGIADSIENFYALLVANAGPSSDPKRLLRLAVDAGSVMRWLEGLGVRFSQDVFEISGSLYPRNYKPVLPNGEGYVRQLSARAAQLGGKIIVGCRADSLVTEMTNQGVPRIAGVRATDAAGQKHVYSARLGVLIACGGFSASRSMLERFAPRYAGLTHDNAPGATGEMILAAQNVGAALVDMQIVQCQPGCPVGGRRRVRFHNDVKRFILVDGSGERFAAEDGRRDLLRDLVLALPGGMAYALIDDDGFRSYNRLIQLDAVLGVESGEAWCADSLDTLARAAGLDSQRFCRTVKDYNRGIAIGRDRFGKKTAFAKPIQTPPFWLAPAAMSVHATSGGIRVDADCHALDDEGQIIPGLWAAGEAAGGLHGDNQLGGCGLTDAFVFGHAAAESMLGSSSYTEG